MNFFLKRVNRFWPRRIWQQIFCVLLFIVLLPLITLGTLLTKTSQQAIQTSVLHDHAQIALHATGEVNENVKGAQQALSMVASVLGMIDDLWRQETVIVELSLKYPEFQSISSLDLSGQELVTSQLGRSLKNYSNQEAFQQALAGKSFISQVQHSQNNIPKLILSAPVKQLGRIKGVLLAELDMRRVWDIVDSIQIGETGRAYLVDEKGRVIAHSDKKKVVQQEALLTETILEDLQSLKSGSGEYLGEDQEKWLISYAPIPSLRWGLVIVHSGQEAYAFSNILKTQSWVLIAVSIFLTIFISLMISRVVSRPLNEMVEGTRKIAKGDFSHTFQVRQRNEMGRLFFSFNRMTLQLKQAQQNEKLSIVGKAATAIAHDLKNSLVLVNTFISLLPKNHRSKKFIDDFSQTVPQELEGWRASLQNIMTFSQTSGIECVAIKVNPILDSMLILLETKARQKNINVQVDLSPKLPLIIGHEKKIREVLLNLVNNALEAAPVQGSISLKSFLKNDRVFVRLTNTVPKDIIVDKRKIFEPFYTTKSEGLGLGLSISWEIVQRLGGLLEVEQDNDKIHFTLSFLVATEADVQSSRKKSV